jgi:hypothetical protein
VVGFYLEVLDRELMMMDGPTVAVCMAVLGSNAALWYKIGRLEIQVKLLNSGVHKKS